MVDLLNKKDALIAQQEAEIEAIKEQLKKANEEISWLKEQFKLSCHRQFGKQTEKISAQYSLFDENECDEVTETREPIDKEHEKVRLSRKKKGTGSHRKIDTSLLEREQIIYDLNETEKICACGCTLQKMGEDRSEKIDFIPAKLKVIEHITLKYTCRSCEVIRSGQKPESPMPKSMATSNFVVDVVLKKYDEHLPLYRQSKIFEREGVVIPDNTLGNWVMGAAEALSPLREALWQEINHTTYLQADETTVKILQPDKKGFMWAYHGLDPGNQFILFEFDLTRASHVPENRLKDFKGLLQTDGYQGYKNIGKQRPVTHLGCWDHARRKFVDADKICIHQKQSTAAQFICLISKLYQIERSIKTATNEERYKVRQSESREILDRIFDQANKLNALPKSTLGNAITYLKNNEIYLRRYCDHGNAHISNCLIENHIRPFAVGRKNWMFVGNPTSANKSALLYSLIQSCKINKLNPRKYLTYVLNQAHAMRRRDVDAKSLLPQFINHDLLK
jgi:transposase